MSPDFDEALKALRPQAGGPAHDTLVGACWDYRRVIGREREAWTWISGGADLLAHVDCERLWMDALPARSGSTAATAPSTSTH